MRAGAISGCMVTGMAIPIIAHNFNQYYKYMKNFLNESKYHKAKCRDDAELVGGTPIGRPLAILQGIPGLRKMIGGNRATAVFGKDNVMRSHSAHEGLGAKCDDEKNSVKSDWNGLITVPETEKRTCSHFPAQTHGFCEESEPLLFARPDRPKMSSADCVDRSKLNLLVGTPSLRVRNSGEAPCDPANIRFELVAPNSADKHELQTDRLRIDPRDSVDRSRLASSETESRCRTYSEGQQQERTPVSIASEKKRAMHSGDQSKFEELAGTRPVLTLCHKHKQRQRPFLRSASANAIITSRREEKAPLE